MNQSEQITALTALVVQLHRQGGLAIGLRQKAFGLSGDSSSSMLGKMCGVSAETIYAWEKGTLEPTPTQALVWLGVLHSHKRGSA